MQLSLKTFIDAYCSETEGDLNEFDYHLPTGTCWQRKQRCLIPLRNIVTDIVKKHTMDDAVSFPRPEQRIMKKATYASLASLTSRS